MTFPYAITYNGRTYTQPPSIYPVTYSGWRVRYPSEGGNWNPDGMPAVSPSVNARPIEFTKELQVMSWELATKINLTITKKQWRDVYSYDKAFTNQNGFDEPGDQRADWVNLLNLDKINPSLMKAIVCAGNFFNGVVERNGLTGLDELVMYPGVHAIDANQPTPAIDTIIRNRWFFYASNWHEGANKGSPFAQGNGGHFAIPFCLRERTPYPIAWMQKWVSSELPETYKVYEL